jgi:hypothetical protein
VIDWAIKNQNHTINAALLGETEAPILTFAESQLALASLASLCAGGRDTAQFAAAAAQAGAADGITQG